MSIDYFGHSTRDAADAQKRIEHVRRAHPEWFDYILILYDAKPPGRFAAEIAREFGVESLKSTFMLSVNDKERFAECLDEALEFLYQVFGTDTLTLTHGLDMIRPPRKPYAATDLS